MKFNKLAALGLAAALSVSPVAVMAESTTEAATELTGPQEATYTFYNTTGEDIVSLYVYATEEDTEAATEGTTEAVETVAEAVTEASTEAEDSLVDPVKGENLAGKDGLADGESVEYVLTVDASEVDTVASTVEFTTKSGYTGKFTTLHFETVPVCLIAEDAVSGATQIAFGLPQTTEATTEAN